MLTHHLFPDLVLHSDEELAQALGSGVVGRRTIHEWPLSWVQRVILEDGRRLAYKSQLPPTVEPEFYARASSRLLTRCRSLGRLGGCETMAINWIRSPPLRAVAGGEAGLIEHGRRVVELIGQIGGDPPVHLDAGSTPGWRAVTQSGLRRLAALVEDGRFGGIAPDAVDRLRDWADSADVARALPGSRLTHGDLRADQIFVTPDGYRVVDWQRPVVAPPDTDLVALLVGEHVDPRPHVDRAVVDIFWYLRLHWAVDAQFDLFPEFRGPLFEQWADEAIGNILAN